VVSPVSQLTLPSGRVVELREPLWGDELHVTTLGLQQGPEEYTYAKYAAIVPSLTREEIAALSREDGRALTREVTRIFEGRPEDQEAPFGNGSASPSKVARSRTKKSSSV
jgi:hypothetical protein